MKSMSLKISFILEKQLFFSFYFCFAFTTIQAREITIVVRHPIRQGRYIIEKRKKVFYLYASTSIISEIC